MPTATYTGTFQTADVTAPVISSLAHGSITSTGVTITWTTNEVADSEVEIATNSSFTGSTFTPITDTSPRVTSHSKPIAGLVASTQYWYRARSRDASGNLTVSSSGTFTTSASADVTPPVISAVTVDVFDTYAIVRWTTNEPADTRIDWGTTSARGTLTTLLTPLVTAHEQMITGLTPNTQYHYAPISKDAAANSTTGDDRSFVTRDNLAAIFGVNLKRWYEIGRQTDQANGTAIISPTDHTGNTTTLTQGTPADRPTWEDFAFGEADGAEFTSGNEFWRDPLASSTDVALTGNAAWIAQVRVPSANTGALGIAHRMETDSTDGWNIAIGQGGSSPGQPSFLASGASSGTWQKAAVNVADDEVHLIVWVRTGTTLNVYVDRPDNLVGTFTVVANTSAAAGNGFEWGRFAGGSSPFIGFMNLLALIDTAPTQAQLDRVFAIYSSAE